MQATITGGITVECENPLKHPLLQMAAKENRFNNPAYIAAVRMGNKPWGIPRHLDVYEATETGMTLPRGYGKRLEYLAKHGKVGITWGDKRVSAPAAYPAKLQGVELRETQQRVIAAALKVTQGVIEMPTGSGKTITALDLIRRLSQRAVVIVHSKLLADQWRAVIKDKLGLVAGMIGNGMWREGEVITVAMVQTLSSQPEKTAAFAAKIGIVVNDECHHSPAGTFAKVIGMFPGRYRYGFTATPKRGDGLEEVIYRLLGPMIARVAPAEVEAVGAIVTATVHVVDTGCRYPHIGTEKKNAWSTLVSTLAADPKRNALVAKVAMDVAVTRQTLVLTERVAHAVAVAGLIPGALLLHGELPEVEKVTRMGQVKSAKVVVGTKGMLGEGLDQSVWAAVVLASPISGETPLVQGVGRATRPGEGKIDAQVWDLVDSHPFAMGSFNKRVKIYKKRNWKINGQVHKVPSAFLPLTSAPAPGGRYGIQPGR